MKFVLSLLVSLLLMSACQTAAPVKSSDYTVPELVLVQGSSFIMGDETGDLWDGSRPVHPVTLTYNYWIGKYQIVYDEYDQFTMETDREAAYDHGWGRERRPVVSITWWDIIAYCNWLSQKEGLQPAYSRDEQLLDRFGKVTTDITQVEGYRLPTEAEWEYAASGGHAALPFPPRFLFSGSDELDEVGWYSGNSGDEWIFTGQSLNADYSRHGGALYVGRSTQEVGQKLPNQLGIYDMSGNVWEWCHDWYAPYTAAAKVNPIGADSGHTRVMRGGSWIFGANDCRVANRFYRGAYDKVFRLGFRIARTVL